MSNKIKALVGALCVSVALSGCTTVNPYTNEEQTAKAASGSAIGALAGALIGVASSSKKDRGKGALIGAAAGAALGGGIGYYMDVQEAKLRQQLRGTGVSVARDGNNIILNMPNNVTFDTNSTSLKPAGINTLSGVAMILKEYEKTMVNIIGYTDSTGKRAYNMQLSERRAQSVASNLMMQGVSASRLRTYGAGPDNPIASNNTESGRAQNRRVEITLSPIQ
ncbi:MAG: OmpA family lipoprotein [Plesiomonas shigelloides]